MCSCFNLNTRLPDTGKSVKARGLLELVSDSSPAAAAAAVAL